MTALPELAADPRFGSTRERALNQVALKDLLQQRFVRQGVAHWLAAFAAAGVPPAAHARGHGITPCTGRR